MDCLCKPFFDFDSGLSSKVPTPLAHFLPVDTVAAQLNIGSEERHLNLLIPSRHGEETLVIRKPVIQGITSVIGGNSYRGRKAFLVAGFVLVYIQLTKLQTLSCLASL